MNKDQCECGHNHSEAGITSGGLPNQEHMLFFSGAVAGSAFIMNMMEAHFERLGMKELFEEALANFSSVEYAVTIDNADVAHSVHVAKQVYIQASEAVQFSKIATELMNEGLFAEGEEMEDGK